MNNDPQVLVKLLRAIAEGEAAKECNHDIIFNAVATLIAEMSTMVKDAFINSETFLGSTQTLMRRIDELEKTRNDIIEECAVVSDSFWCGCCGMDGKPGQAIRNLKTQERKE